MYTCEREGCFCGDVVRSKVEGNIPFLGRDRCDSSNDWISCLWVVGGVRRCYLDEFVGSCDGSSRGGY